MKKYLHITGSLFIPLLFCIFGYSQKNETRSVKIDSLQKLLQTQQQDTNRVKTLIALSSMQYQQREISMKYANEAISLSRELNFISGEGKAYYTYATALMGLNYSGEMGDLNEVLRYYNLALERFKTLNAELDVANCYSQIASAYKNIQQNYPEWLANLMAASIIYERLDNKPRSAACARELGMFHMSEGNSKDAAAMMDKAIKIYREIKDTGQIAYTQNFIGRLFLQHDKFEQSLQHLDTAIKLYQSMGQNAPAFAMPWTKGNIGQVYFLQGGQAIASGNITLAAQKLKEALQIFLERLKMENEGNLTHLDVYFQLGDCNFKLAEINTSGHKRLYLAESQKYYNLALQIAKETNNRGMFAGAYYGLSKVNEANGDYKNSYENYKQYILYRDSLSNEESIKKIAQIKLQNEFDKKEAAAKTEQNKKDAATARVRNLQYGAIAIFLLLAIFLFLNNRLKQRSKIKIEKAYADLKATQSQLIQSEKMASLGELTAGIAHEIQNPLNFVNNFSDVNTELIDEVEIEVEKGNIADAKAILTDIKENEQKINLHGKRADAIVKGMLQHSRTSSGQKELTDINALCDEYLRLAYHGLRAKDKRFNAKFETDFDTSIGKINVVPQDMGRVILNLINNAFYAAPLPPEGGFREPDGKHIPTVWVSTKKEGNRVLITVRDNGPGIPQNIIDKIFQPFFTTKPTGQGTGLGLSLSYDIVKAHGGTILVHIEAGKGSEFRLQLNR